MTFRPKRHAPRTRAETASPARLITDAIIAKLEEGTSPWRRPWTSAASIERPLRACGKPYRGINTIWLWHVAEQRGFTMPTWMTYRQAAELGGQVRKGEKSTIAVFYKSYGKTEQDPATGEEQTSQRRILKTYNVFNVGQIDGLPDRFVMPPEPRVRPPETHRAEIDAFIAASGATMITGGSRACYIPSLDVVHMPDWQDFESYAQYGAVAAHELTHWTGHPSRLNREMSGSFGSETYAREELCAELSSALIGAELGLPVTHLDNHASYIASWIKLLQHDERALLSAAAKAEAAACWLLERAGRATDAPDVEGDADSSEAPPMAA
jgi:antirestriction protein ArdC